MSERTTVKLGPSVVRRVAGLKVGLMALKPDEQAPEAVIGVFNPATCSPEQHLVRVGDRFHVAGRCFEIDHILPEGRGRIELTVTWNTRS